MKQLYLITLFIIISVLGYSQERRLDDLMQKLDYLTYVDPAFLEEIDISVGNIPIGDLVRNVAKASKVNIGYKGDNNMLVNCSLNRTSIIDLIHFLCHQYNLDFDIVGNIISIYPYQPPKTEPPRPSVEFNLEKETLSYDFKNILLIEATKLIADASGINVIIPQGLYQKYISGYVVNLSVEDAIRSLAESNDLLSFKTTNKLWAYEPKLTNSDGSNGNIYRRKNISNEQLSIDSTGLINIQVQQANIYDIICGLCDKLNLNYYFISPINGQTSLFLKDVELHTFLKVLFTGTSFSYYEEEGIYMFGISKEEILSSVKVVEMKNRTINKLVDIIPDGLKSGVKIQSFGDLNSMILSGDQTKVSRVEQFLKMIDKTVPLITIEVIIVDATKRTINEAGLSLGVGKSPPTSGTLSPGIDMEFNASAINKLINSFNGFGALNLGKVNSNFYAGLQFLEEKGDIELQSTPKLSTLNGYEAELKSGERRFYKEVNESFMGSQNPIQTSSYQWKSIDANLSVKIIPIVSGNNEITLNIEIEQSEFTAKEEKDAPPGTATRSFKSQIRVLNEEMVLLGGIDKNDREKVSNGLPLIARIPVLKWVFGKAKDNKEIRKLNVFIKPTVIF